ncbi:Myb-like DNA-binding domain, putative [Babesia ovis]|uniref:Myb-like DNA-binding domain, putative n=1 Tax=Babesia ovis TaxID=5869 RepID=A0A9W5TCR7_BABOV|nr:Myb-like DNA-binding domain, putative [Babesia ovis]
MEDNQDYQLTRRRSKLRDQFQAIPPAEVPEATPTNYGYQRNSRRDSTSTVTGYRDNNRREYGTRYKGISTEDSYARQYDSSYLYSRRAVYSHEYGVYNMRPKPPGSRNAPASDNAYVDTRVYTASRRSSSSSSSTRRGLETAVNAVEATPRANHGSSNSPLSNDVTGRMQLRYSLKRQSDTGYTKPVDEVATPEEPSTSSSVSQMARVRPFSPRIAQRRAASVVKYDIEPTDVNPVVESPIETALEIKHENVEMSVPQEEIVATKETLVNPTDENVAETAVVDTAEIVAEPEVPPKRKRGRPRGTRQGTARGASVPRSDRAKRTRAASGNDLEGDPAAPPTPKRSSARIRSNNLAHSYAIATRLADDEYEEQLKKAIAMSIKDAQDDEENGTGSTSGSDEQHANGKIKTKDINGMIVDEDMRDMDYNPTTPTRALNGNSNKEKNKNGSKKGIDATLRSPNGKIRNARRAKECKLGVTTPVSRIDEFTQTLPTDPVVEAVPIVKNGADSARMLLFEEYLDMSERMYCGKPLCVRRKPDPTETNTVEENNVDDDSSDEEVLSKLQMVEDTHPIPAERRMELAKTKQNANGILASLENNATEATEIDDMFEFQCSNLDIRFRVAFSMLTSDLRQTQMLDLWGPKEIVLFELGMFKYGKEFHEIQRHIPTKTVQDIVDMYYFWKKSNRYKLWKANRQY